MDYILMADWHFMGLALRELRGILGVERLKIPRRLSESVIVVDIDRCKDEMAGLMDAARPTFIDMLLPLLATAKVDGYESIAGALAKVLDKNTTFKIEAMRMGSVVGDKAKSVEVRLGNMLEEQGFHADMDDPKCMAYLVLSGNDALVSRVDGKPAIMDWFRAFNRMRYDAINRSELKLDEAVRYFSVDMDGAGTCLDIGAAPGGWTDYLARHGRRVVAVDSAMLDYKRLCRYGSVVVAVENNTEDAAALLSKIDSNIFATTIGGAKKACEAYRPAVLHLKSAMDGAALDALDGLGPFGMVTMDANVAPDTACAIMDSVARFAEPGSALIMTIKLVDKKIEERIKYVKEVISSNYGSIAVKKLPHNRMEVTLFARRR